MTHETLLEKVRRVMAATFELEPAAIPDDASPENLAKWDSLHNMNLIVALEEQFGVQFTDEEVMGSLSLPGLVAAIERHRAR